MNSLHVVFLRLSFSAFLTFVAASPRELTPSALTTQPMISGRLLEGCSCIVPCPCNFGAASRPHSFCDSLAFFEFHQGNIEGVALKGLRFAIASRGGSRATLYIDLELSEPQRNALRKIGTWILSLEGTPLSDVRTASVKVDFEDARLAGSIEETDAELTAFPLKGNDGRSSIVVSHPWIFGSFPVSSSRKCVVEKLHVRSGGLAFDYSATNANDAVFEFLPSQVK